MSDVFSDKGDKDRHDKVTGTITELFALTKGIKFESLLLLYRAVFLSRLTYNCEAWSGFTTKDLKTLEPSQLSHLRGILEVSKRVPTSAHYLELGVLSISFEIKLKQLLYLKRVLDREYDDPVLKV